ncbi:DUF72 domain-containing protein [Paraburkholderia phytofirmans]|uniref:DUF72 domain-containing protein n=1 Tax=Paraburkholderia phytofirmans TaxID=261302 RepID=UPI0038BBF64E
MPHASHSRNLPTTPPVRIGCAGWGLPTKIASQFPAPGSHLERYAQIFSSVEINSSFYRPDLPKTYARWAASVPDAFRFSVKIPRTISHELRLKDADAAVRKFMLEITSLGEKLGCLLLQLPPSFALDVTMAQDFFSLLRDFTSAHIICEPRHVSWFSEEGAKAMQDAGVACVRAHPAPVPGVEPAGDADTLYIRLHGSPKIYYSAYDEPFIEAVAGRIVEARSSNVEVWCIFDNTALGEAVANAMSLMDELKKMDN